MQGVGEAGGDLNHPETPSAPNMLLLLPSLSFLSEEKNLNPPPPCSVWAEPGVSDGTSAVRRRACKYRVGELNYKV